MLGSEAEGLLTSTVLGRVDEVRTGLIILFERMLSTVVILSTLSPCSSPNSNNPVRKAIMLSFLNCSIGVSPCATVCGEEELRTLGELTLGRLG